MKVVLFCGGMGMRMKEYSETIPKPMVNIGYRPVLWHVMKYYAHFGHKDFILCLGYKADYIKNYFLNYNESLSNDFVLSKGGEEIQLFNSDIEDWKITFADTGVKSNIGERLSAVKKYLEGEDMFLANYSDGLTDFPLPELLDFFSNSNKTACFLSVKPNLSYHIVNVDNNRIVSGINAITRSDIWINGGYFAFTKDIFNYIEKGEELVVEPFKRLVDKQELTAYKYEGFWVGVDTFKDKEYIDTLYSDGDTPWQVWKQP